MDEHGYKRGDIPPPIILTHSLTQTSLERLEEGERGLSGSNDVEAKSKDRHSDL